MRDEKAKIVEDQVEHQTETGLLLLYLPVASLDKGNKISVYPLCTFFLSSLLNPIEFISL